MSFRILLLCQWIWCSRRHRSGTKSIQFSKLFRFLLWRGFLLLFPGSALKTSLWQVERTTRNIPKQNKTILAFYDKFWLFSIMLALSFIFFGQISCPQTYNASKQSFLWISTFEPYFPQMWFLWQVWQCHNCRQKVSQLILLMRQQQSSISCFCSEAG